MAMRRRGGIKCWDIREGKTGDDVKGRVSGEQTCRENKLRRGRAEMKACVAPVRDELQRRSEVLVVVGNPLHQGLLVGYLQLDASLCVVEMGFVVLLRNVMNKGTEEEVGNFVVCEVRFNTPFTLLSLPPANQHKRCRTRGSTVYVGVMSDTWRQKCKSAPGRLHRFAPAAIIQL